MLESPLRIIGQGLAGSLLGWACERAGIAFRVIDAGHAGAASQAAAGLVTPLTGRRLVATWRFAEERESALAVYRELEAALQVELVKEMRLRRRFRDAAERARWEPRWQDPTVARWIEARDDAGLWMRGAAQVETARLIAALRRRWAARGWLEERSAAPGEEGPAVWCTGAAGAPGFEFVPWERAHGEILNGELEGLDADVILNDGQWVLPGPAGWARVGATYDRAPGAVGPTSAGRAWLQAAAERLTGRPLLVRQQLSGVRVTTPDRRPVIGWHPARRGWGILSGLGSKGALWAPGLAAQWVEQLQHGSPFDATVDVARFWP